MRGEKWKFLNWSGKINFLIHQGTFNRIVGFQKQFNKGHNDKLQKTENMRGIFIIMIRFLKASQAANLELELFEI